MQIYSHSPESCPIGNSKNLEATMNWLKKVDAVAAKHGVKVVGIWTDPWGNRSWAVFDAPDMGAFEEFEQEPENLEKIVFTNVETRTVIVPLQTLAFFEKLKLKVTDFSPNAFFTFSFNQIFLRGEIN